VALAFAAPDTQSLDFTPDRGCEFCASGVLPEPAGPISRFDLASSTQTHPVRLLEGGGPHARLYMACFQYSVRPNRSLTLRRGVSTRDARAVAEPLGIYV
jgi:hypothetical protein